MSFFLDVLLNVNVLILELFGCRRVTVTFDGASEIKRGVKRRHGFCKGETEVKIPSV